MEVRFSKIVKRYGDVFAVKDLSLTIEDGALHFFLGPSGCGKTTTLRMLAGLEKPTSGEIFFSGKDVTNKPAAERNIGMVFQNYALWPHMTVRKNIEYGLKLKKLATKEIATRLEDVLNITQLGKYVDRLPGQLSGGQQQRVALARALAIRPNVLLLDEPLSNLDAQLRLEMRDNISRIHKQTQITTVYVTHDQKEALSMGTAVSVMRAGVLEQTDAPRRLYYHPASPFIAGFIGETNIVKGKISQAVGKGFLVATSLGDITATNFSDKFSVGDEVVLSIRPEAFVVNFSGKEPLARGDKDKNVLRLTLDHLTYLGEYEQYQLKDTRGTRLKATVFHAPEHDLRDGSQIECMIAWEDVLILRSKKDG